MNIKEKPRDNIKLIKNTVIPKIFEPTKSSNGPNATPKKNNIHLMLEKKFTIVFLNS